MNFELASYSLETYNGTMFYHYTVMIMKHSHWPDTLRIISSYIKWGSIQGVMITVGGNEHGNPS